MGWEDHQQQVPGERIARKNYNSPYGGGLEEPCKSKNIMYEIECKKCNLPRSRRAGLASNGG